MKYVFQLPSVPPHTSSSLPCPYPTLPCPASHCTALHTRARDPFTRVLCARSGDMRGTFRNLRRGYNTRGERPRAGRALALPPDVAGLCPRATKIRRTRGEYGERTFVRTASRPIRVESRKDGGVGGFGSNRLESRVHERFIQLASRGRFVKFITRIERESALLSRNEEPSRGVRDDRPKSRNFRGDENRIRVCVCELVKKLN